MEKLIFVLGVVLIVALIFGSYADQKEWEAFKSAHACEVVGKERGTVSTGVAPVIGGSGGVGVVMMSSPDKTGWLCDDGITYWR